VTALILVSQPSIFCEKEANDWLARGTGLYLRMVQALFRLDANTSANPVRPPRP
jgi:hypothetical protein